MPKKRIEKKEGYRIWSFNLNGSIVKKLEEHAKTHKRSASKQLEFILEKFFRED
tara:strand:- start:570 stop:731 length:162 start_codon:yes stop_codon:yes gene_type:complete